MVGTFRGNGTQKVDGKGRVSILADYRPAIRAGDPNWSEGKLPEFVIVYGGERREYLECFTMDAAMDMDARIAALPRGSKDRRRLQKLFHGQSMKATVDDTGRIVLSKMLRDKLKMEGEAYFISAGDTFQIWEPKTYARIESEADDFGDLDEGEDEWVLLERAEAG